MAEGTYHIEKQRRASDLLRVYNPLDEDYVVKWDAKNGAKLFRFHAKKETVAIRYIAEKFMREMFDKIIIEKANKAVIEENEKRISKGFAEMTPWREQATFEQPFYQLSEEETAKILATLYVGVEQEFGVDREVEPIEETKPGETTFSSAMEKVQSGKVETTQNKKFSCKYPGCDFESDHNVALQGHMRSHRDDNIEDKKKKAVASISQ